MDPGDEMVRDHVEKEAKEEMAMERRCEDKLDNLRYYVLLPEASKDNIDSYVHESACNTMRKCSHGLPIQEGVRTGAIYHLEDDWEACDDADIDGAVDGIQYLRENGLPLITPAWVN